MGQWLFLSGHGVEGEKFLRLVTYGEARPVFFPAQRAAAVLLSKIELQRGNISQSAIWMRRAVIGVFEDKGSGTEEIADTLMEYAQYLSATRRFLDAFNIYSKLAPIYQQGLPSISPKYLHFQALFLDVMPEIAKFSAADDLYGRLHDDVGRVDFVPPSVRGELFFQGLYRLARSKSESDRDTLQRQLVEIVDSRSDLLKYPLYRMILMYFAILCNDVDLAERVESSTVNQVPGNLQTDAYKDALDSFIAARRGSFDRSISLVDKSRLKIEAYHDQFEAETVDQLPAISAEERAVMSEILGMDLPHAATAIQQDALFKAGQFLNRDRTKLGLNQSVNRRALKSDLLREDAFTRDRLRDLRDQLLRDATTSLLARALPIRVFSVVQNNDFSVLTRLEDVEDKLVQSDEVLAGSALSDNQNSSDLETVHALLKDNEALIIHNVVPNGLAVQCLSSKNWMYSVSNYSQPEITQLISDEKKLSESLHATNPPLKLDDNTRFPFDSASRLFQFFFGRSDECLKGKTHILLATDPDFFALPWNALVTEPPAGQDLSFRDAAWLPRKYAISLLPSVKSIYQIRQVLQASRARRAFLGIGDPDLGQPGQSAPVTLGPLFSSRGVANVAEIKALQRLPDAANELRSEATALGSSDADLLLGADATERSLRLRPLQDYRVVSFATHAIVAGGIPGITEPALVLTPANDSSAQENGLLTATKITKLALDANLVILSACNTAADDGHASGRGLSGLADAFFFAGARAVAVTQWAVVSSSAEKLASGLILQSAKRGSAGVAEGLRDAMLDYISEAKEDYLANPRFWAAFIIAGDGAVNPTNIAPQNTPESDVIALDWEHIEPGTGDLALIDAARSSQGEVYGVGKEEPPSGEKDPGSYLVKIDSAGAPVVIKRDSSLVVSGIAAVGDQIAVLGGRPSDHKSAAVFEMLDAQGHLSWQYAEDDGYWNFPLGVIQSGGTYLLISAQKTHADAEHNALIITRVSNEGVPIDHRIYQLSIQPDPGPSRNVAVSPSNKLIIAVRGNPISDPKVTQKTWVNQRTGSRKFCPARNDTELLEIDPATLATEKTKVLENLYIVSIKAQKGRLFAAGTSTSNCRIEKQTNIVEFTRDYETKSIFVSTNVNNLGVLDMQITPAGQFLLGGLTLTFLPTNPTFSANQFGASQFDHGSEAFWDTTEWRSAAFVLLVDQAGVVLGDKVFSDPRGRGISTVRAWVGEKYLIFGSAFGKREWIAGIRLSGQASSTAAPR